MTETVTIEKVDVRQTKAGKPYWRAKVQGGPWASCFDHPLEAGETYYGRVEEDGDYKNLKVTGPANTADLPLNGSAPQQRDERGPRIERQHSQEMAIRFHALELSARDGAAPSIARVAELTDIFVSDLDAASPKSENNHANDEINVLRHTPDGRETAKKLLDTYRDADLKPSEKQNIVKAVIGHEPDAFDENTFLDLTLAQAMEIEHSLQQSSSESVPF